MPAFVAGDAIEVLDYSEGDAAGMPDSHFWTDPARMIDVVDALEPVLAELEGIDAEALDATRRRLSLRSSGRWTRR